MAELQVKEATNEASIVLHARKLALGTPDGFLAFGFGSGLLTRAPGTIGTLAAVPFALILQRMDGAAVAWWLIIAFFCGVWVCQSVADKLGVEDYGGIVWDEMVGYWLAVAWAPDHWLWLIVGFGLFRFFDILKPWPISVIESRFSGGLGIMLDDVAAGIYTAILMAGAQVVLFSR